MIDGHNDPELASPAALDQGSEGASALLRTAEAAFANRVIVAAFIVCPVGWMSKIELLEYAGYETALVWPIKQ